MGFDGASGFHPPGGGGGGGTIGGGGTLNYVAMFTPDGVNIGDAPIKIGDTITKSLPGATGSDSVSIGFDTVNDGDEFYTVGYNMNIADGRVGFLIGHDVNIDDTAPTYGDGNIFLFGTLLTITGGQFVDAIVSLGFFHNINATQETRGVYMLGDSFFINDFATYSTLIGESCNYTRVDHTTSIGIFHDVIDSTFVYIFGEGNFIDTVTSSTIIGLYNNIDNSDNIVNVGNGNVYSGITNALIIGINNSTPLSDEILIAINDVGIRVDINGDVGVGVPSVDTIDAKLHVKGIDLTTNVNQRLEPIDGVYEDTTGSTLTVTTGGAASTDTLQLIPVPTNTGILIECYVTSRKSAGAGGGTVGDVNGYIRTVKAKNVGGVVTIGVVQSSFTSEDIAPLNATFDVSGTDVRLRVTTSANNTIKWNVVTKTFPVT